MKEVDRRGFEPRSSGCKPDIFPLDQQPELTSVTRWRSRESILVPGGVEPPLPACRAGVVPFDHGTVECISDQSCGGRIRTCGLVVQSHEFLPTETTPQETAGIRTMSAQSVSRESNPPVRGGSPMPLPLGQRHILFLIINQRIIPMIADSKSAEGEGVEPSRPCSSSVFKTVVIAN